MGGFDRHCEHVGDQFAVQLDGERLTVIARAIAVGARRIDAGQEEKLDAYEALALTRRASALGQIEREAAGVVAAPARLLGCREEFPDIVK